MPELFPRRDLFSSATLLNIALDTSPTAHATAAGTASFANLLDAGCSQQGNAIVNRRF